MIQARTDSQAPALTPAFLFSLPRSGSTLLQRLIGAHESVATCSEPWLLLAPFFARREQGALALYGQRTAARGLNDALQTAEDGEALFRSAVRTYALHVYEGLSYGCPVFLDKTPRYHLIANDIISTFPEGKYIVLWRHPFATVASLVNTFGNGRWIIHRFKDDLYCGIDRLVEVQDRLGDRAYRVNYERLITEPQIVLREIFAYLNLTDVGLSSQQHPIFAHLSGRMGDQSGTADYTDICQLPLQKWALTLGTPWRKAWCRRYLDWLGPSRCAAMGYDFECLQGELDRLSVRYSRVGSDFVHRAYGIGYRRVLRRLFYDQ